MYENASLTPKGREAMARSVIDGACRRLGRRGSFAPRPRPSPSGSNVSASRARRACATVRRGPIHRQAKPSQACRLGGGRGFAKAAPYRRANWRRGVSLATVSRMLKRLGLNRLSPLEPAEPVRRYERAAPGEIFHIDIKKLGKFSRIGHRVTGDRTDQSNTRGVGWEICASGDRRPSPSRLLGDPTQRKAQLLTAFPVQRPALLSRPRRQG
jgi:hypothetical protein